MSKRLILILVAVAALLFAGAYAGSPLLAVRGFVAAAKAGNAERLDSAIDFPAVRDSLKSQMTAALNERMADDPKLHDTPFAALGSLLIPTIVDKLVDSLVTPDGIAQLVRRGEVRKPGTDTPPARPPTYSYSYIDLDRFRVTLTTPDRPESPAGLIFERRGLFSWKLVRVEIPKALIPSST
jgi:hypothetical protein